MREGVGGVLPQEASIPYFFSVTFFFLFFFFQNNLKDLDLPC